jgi:hypothetical protein
MSPFLPPLPLPQAKRRALRRRTASGGTMFVVAMTLAVLSTIGAWALQSAALEVRVAGYERQSTQTHYLAEYGVVATMQDVNPSVATVPLGLATCGSSGTYSACLSIPCLDFTQSPPRSTCGEIANPVPLVSHSCLRLEGATATTSEFMPSNMNPLDSSDGGISGTPGSLGPTNVSGNFSAEITEIGPAPPSSGFSQGTQSNAGFYWATLTSFGQTTTAAGAVSQGNEQLRARVEIGPITPLGNCP